MGGIYEAGFQMGSDAMIYIPNFIKIGSGIQKLIRGGYTDTQKGRSHKPTLGKLNKNISVHRYRRCATNGNVILFLSENFVKTHD
jgi:hypothetical protein